MAQAGSKLPGTGFDQLRVTIKLLAGTAARLDLILTRLARLARRSRTVATLLVRHLNAGPFLPAGRQGFPFWDLTDCVTGHISHTCSARLPLCVGRSTVAQKIQKNSEAYLHIFWTYACNARGLHPFHINKIQFYCNLAREKENEWDLDKSIHCQKFQVFVAEHPDIFGKYIL